MSARPIGRGMAVIAHEGMLEIRRRQCAARRTASAPLARRLPGELAVRTWYACHRWHAQCRKVIIHDHRDARTAAYAAAQEAWGQLIGHGILLRQVSLQPVDETNFVSTLRNAEEAA